LLWAVISAVAMVGSTPLAAWSDQVGRKHMLVVGYGLYGLFYLLIGHLQTPGLWVFPLFASYGLFLSATEGVEKALVADLADPHHRGTAFGWFNLTTGLMVLPASLGFGWLYESVGSRTAFTAGATCALGAAIWLSQQTLPRAASAGSQGNQIG
jgi:MFS family permease